MVLFIVIYPFKLKLRGSSVVKATEIAYRKGNVILRTYPAAWVGRKHRKKHTWTGHRIRKRERHGNAVKRRK